MDKEIHLDKFNRNSSTLVAKADRSRLRLIYRSGTTHRSVGKYSFSDMSQIKRLEADTARNAYVFALPLTWLSLKRLL